MDISTLTRSAKKIRANLVEMEDNSIVVREGCKIYIPSRFINKGLAGIGDNVWALGCFLIVTDSGFYDISLAQCDLFFEPADIRQVKLPDEKMYYEMYFPAGSTFIQSSYVKKSDKNIDPMFEEFIINGNIPYGYTVVDLVKLFRHAVYFTGFNMGANNQIYETMVSIICRARTNLNSKWGYVINNQAQLISEPPVIVGLRNAPRLSTNTTAKLLGSYFNDGVVSALNNPSTRLEGVEGVMRK